MAVEPKTVSQILTAATDSVTLINSINTDASAEPLVQGKNQAEINSVVDKNVKHLETILAYEPVDSDDDTPDVAGSSENKKSYLDAISTGKEYITNNS